MPTRFPGSFYHADMTREQAEDLGMTKKDSDPLACAGIIVRTMNGPHCVKCHWRGHCAKCGKGMQFADGICFTCNGGKDPGD